MPVTALTREPQYRRLLDIDASLGRHRLGLMSNQTWQDDPKRLGFVLARYKFVAKMFAGHDAVAEIGCGDGFASRIVEKEVGRLWLYDFDPVFVSDARENLVDSCARIARHDILAAPLPRPIYDAIYSLDVLEHIDAQREPAFFENLMRSLSSVGEAIIGMPSLESQAYASPQSRAGHVNCKTGPQLRVLLKRYFRSVFLFSMNDEVVHTGFSPMAHYLLAVCANPKN